VCVHFGCHSPGRHIEGLLMKLYRKSTFGVGRRDVQIDRTAGSPKMEFVTTVHWRTEQRRRRRRLLGRQCDSVVGPGMDKTIVDRQMTKQFTSSRLQQKLMTTPRIKLWNVDSTIAAAAGANVNFFTGGQYYYILHYINVRAGDVSWLDCALVTRKRRRPEA